MVTLKEVARAAGCSLTTVSIIANGRGDEMHISPATQKRVQALIQEMGYRPNRSAQMLRNRKPKHPVIAFYWPLDDRVNLIGTRLMSMHGALTENRLDWEIVVQSYTCGHLGEYLGPLYESRYSGAFIAGANEEDMIQLEEADVSVPVVLLNLQSRKYSTVGINHSNIGTRAAALIHRKGHRSCAVIRMQDSYGGTTKRTASFLYNCQQLGIETRPEWTFSGSANLVGGAQATEEYCAPVDRSRMVYYENDSMAQGGLYVLQRNGIRVPEDVESLSIGMRDPESSQYLTPSISCIDIPSNVEKQAVSVMQRLLEEKPKAPIHVEMEPIIRLRESFAAEQLMR